MEPFMKITQPRVGLGERWPISGKLVRTIVGRSMFITIIALMTVPATRRASSAETSGFNAQGPWVYTHRIDPASEAVWHMATTVALEDDNVWLLLTCGEDRTMTVSIMHVEGFSYPVESSVSVSLRIDRHPTVRIPALPISNRQISIDPASSHDLLPLLLEGNRSSVTIADSRGDTHDYSFMLQPNEPALRDIRAICLDHEEQ